ncbi:hypothetical protein LCGC14_2990960, partial [marine sediment metagenome]
MPRAVMELGGAAIAVYAELAKRARRPGTPRLAKLDGHGGRLSGRRSVNA